MMVMQSEGGHTMSKALLQAGGREVQLEPGEAGQWQSKRRRKRTADRDDIVVCRLEMCREERGILQNRRRLRGAEGKYCQQHQ
jgi:hypothetical protein